MEEKEKVWTIPNILCVVRMVLIPLFITLFFTVDIYWSLLVFLIASFTDLLDGFIARTFDMVSDVGKFLDPLADKLLKGATILCFTIKGTLPIYFLIILIILDLFLTVSGAIILSEEIIIPSNIFGKASTLLIIVGYILSFFVVEYPNLSPWHMIVIGVGIGFSVIAAITYGIQYLRLKKSKQNNVVEK